MNKFIYLILISFSLAACGGGDNPDVVVDDPAPEEPAPDVISTCDAGDASVCKGDVNRFVYDATANTISINNLPFDQAGYYQLIGTLTDDTTFDSTLASATPKSFGIYQNAEGLETYYALLQRADATTAGVVGTGGYAGFGYGGTYYSSDGAADLPSTGEARFDGDYAGIRVLNSASTTLGVPKIALVDGQVYARIDFRNFDDIGAVDIVIYNRIGYDTDGTTVLETLNDIGASTTQLDGIFVRQTSIAEIGGSNPTATFGYGKGAGTVEAILGGNIGGNTGEMAGTIEMLFPYGSGSEDDVQETGAFIAEQSSYATPTLP